MGRIFLSHKCNGRAHIYIPACVLNLYGGYRFFSGQWVGYTVNTLITESDSFNHRLCFHQSLGCLVVLTACVVFFCFMDTVYALCCLTLLCGLFGALLITYIERVIDNVH